MDYIDIEGTAHKHGITFEGDVFEVEGYYNKKKVKFKIEEYEEKTWDELHFFEKIDDKMQDFKFLRGLSQLFTYRSLFTILLYILIAFSSGKYANYYMYALELFSFIIAIPIIKFTETGKYHSAEHMAINAYENNVDLNLHNVRKQERYHSLCGSNFVIMRMFILITGMIFNVNFLIMFIIAYLVSDEIVHYLDDNKKRFAFIHKLLKYIQVSLYTAMPEDKHLKLAVKTLNKLIKLEGK
ncbi:DUF1385 domain-containing protein [Metabacillus fastidiosus]|uniref:DUF1385 domain-containing protein n=1 Tax=Metabacillus fastidiosus TaxID=1458 RepID=A0ABU6NS56_9BACI|nr:DUF1385 domain-containing protein [Metabacillus fastidiosus]